MEANNDFEDLNKNVIVIPQPVQNDMNEQHFQTVFTANATGNSHHYINSKGDIAGQQQPVETHPMNSDR